MPPDWPSDKLWTNQKPPEDLADRIVGKLVFVFVVALLIWASLQAIVNLLG